MNQEDTLMVVCWWHGVLTRARNPKEGTRAYVVVVVREIGNAERDSGINNFPCCQVPQWTWTLRGTLKRLKRLRKKSFRRIRTELAKLESVALRTEVKFQTPVRATLAVRARQPLVCLSHLQVSFDTAPPFCIFCTCWVSL